MFVLSRIPHDFGKIAAENTLANPEVLKRLLDVKVQKGLAANPGKTGELFDDSPHPYPLTIQNTAVNSMIIPL